MRLAGSCAWGAGAHLNLPKVRGNLASHLGDIVLQYYTTRNSGRSTPIFLAPAVGWEPYGLPALCAPYIWPHLELVHISFLMVGHGQF